MSGHPKGAMITFGMNFYNAVNLGIPAGISADTVQLVVLPLFHTGGMNCYANPILHAGGRLLLMRDFDPGRALAVLGDVRRAAFGPAVGSLGTARATNSGNDAPHCYQVQRL